MPQQTQDYQQQLDTIHKALAQEFKKLKKIPKHQDPKERQKIKKKIKKLTEQLQDLKFRLAYS